MSADSRPEPEPSQPPAGPQPLASLESKSETSAKERPYQRFSRLLEEIHKGVQSLTKAQKHSAETSAGSASAPDRSRFVPGLNPENQRALPRAEANTAAPASVAPGTGTVPASVRATTLNTVAAPRTEAPKPAPVTPETPRATPSAPVVNQTPAPGSPAPVSPGTTAKPNGTPGVPPAAVTKSPSDPAMAPQTRLTSAPSTKVNKQPAAAQRSAEGPGTQKGRFSEWTPERTPQQRLEALVLGSAGLVPSKTERSATSAVAQGPTLTAAPSPTLSREPLSPPRAQPVIKRFGPNVPLPPASSDTFERSKELLTHRSSSNTTTERTRTTSGQPGASRQPGATPTPGLTKEPRIERSPSSVSPAQPNTGTAASMLASVGSNRDKLEQPTPGVRTAEQATPVPTATRTPSLASPAASRRAESQTPTAATSRTVSQPQPPVTSQRAQTTSLSSAERSRTVKPAGVPRRQAPKATTALKASSAQRAAASTTATERTASVTALKDSPGSTRATTEQTGAQARQRAATLTTNTEPSQRNMPGTINSGPSRSALTAALPQAEAKAKMPHRFEVTGKLNIPGLAVAAELTAQMRAI